MSVSSAEPLCVGLNCALGAEHMHPFLDSLSKIATTNVSAYPNAGLPNAMGGYDEDPETFTNNAMELVKADLINMIGGCCGTTADHIRRLVEEIRRSNSRPRPIPKSNGKLHLSGLKAFVLYDNIPFMNVGERCNISGSLRFKRLLARDGNYSAAL